MFLFGLRCSRKASTDIRLVWIWMTHRVWFPRILRFSGWFISNLKPTFLFQIHAFPLTHDHHFGCDFGFCCFDGTTWQLQRFRGKAGAQTSALPHGISMGGSSEDDMIRNPPPWGIPTFGMWLISWKNPSNRKKIDDHLLGAHFKKPLMIFCKYHSLFMVMVMYDPLMSNWPMAQEADEGGSTTRNIGEQQGIRLLTHIFVADPPRKRDHIESSLSFLAIISWSSAGQSPIWINFPFKIHFKWPEMIFPWQYILQMDDFGQSSLKIFPCQPCFLPRWLSKVSLVLMVSWCFLGVSKHLVHIHTVDGCEIR